MHYAGWVKIRVLGAEMRVPPGGAVHVGLELVGKGGSGGNRALADGGDTVVPLGAFLTDAMPVDCGAFFGAGDVIVDGDFDHVAPVGFNGGPGELRVDEDAAFV